MYSVSLSPFSLNCGNRIDYVAVDELHVAKSDQEHRVEQFVGQRRVVFKIVRGSHNSNNSDMDEIKIKN